VRLVDRRRAAIQAHHVLAPNFFTRRGDDREIVFGEFGQTGKPAVILLRASSSSLASEVGVIATAAAAREASIVRSAGFMIFPSLDGTGTRPGGCHR
jgi:hypothetical protein